MTDHEPTGCLECEQIAEQVAARTVTNLWAAAQSPRLILKEAS